VPAQVFLRVAEFLEICNGITEIAAVRIGGKKLSIPLNGFLRIRMNVGIGEPIRGLVDILALREILEQEFEFLAGFIPLLC